MDTELQERNKKEVKAEAADSAVLRTIREYIESHGYSPTFREIAVLNGWATHSYAEYIIKRLESRGLITHATGVGRSLRLVPQESTLPVNGNESEDVPGNNT